MATFKTRNGLTTTCCRKPAPRLAVTVSGKARKIQLDSWIESTKFLDSDNWITFKSLEHVELARKVAKNFQKLQYKMEKVNSSEREPPSRKCVKKNREMQR